MSKKNLHNLIYTLLYIFYSSVHLGETIHSAGKEKKFPITLLAERLQKSRQHIYNLFQNPDVRIDDILKIGKIILYDFEQDLKELASVPEEFILKKLTEPEIKLESVMYWKSKYFELLEEHKLLLKKKFKSYFQQ